MTKPVTFTLPKHYANADDGTPEGLAKAIGESVPATNVPANPIPVANRVAGMIIADPTQADAIEAYAKQQGGKVSTFLGFKFITLQDPERTLWKLRCIGRLEYHRKAREAARDEAAVAAANKP